MTNDFQEVKTERLFLYWKDDMTHKMYPAGVAFYDEKFGEYRLKLDALSDEKAYYLKPIGANTGKTRYRVEVVIKRNGKFSHRSEIGSGQSEDTDGDIVQMDLGPFSRKLILVFNQKQ